MKKNNKSGRDAQDIQDEIFRKMSADKKLGPGSEFSMHCLERGLPDGAKINMPHLRNWLRKEKISL